MNYFKNHKVCILQKVSEQDSACDIKEFPAYKTKHMSVLTLLPM